eukprot:758402-Hanusia_phi.AAC.7
MQDLTPPSLLPLNLPSPPLLTRCAPLLSTIPSLLLSSLLASLRSHRSSTQSPVYRDPSGKSIRPKPCRLPHCQSPSYFSPGRTWRTSVTRQERETESKRDAEMHTRAIRRRRRIRMSWNGRIRRKKQENEAGDYW